MRKKTILWLLVGCAVPSFALAANGAFQISGDSLFFPDGSSETSAPKDGKSVLNGSGPPSIVANIGDFFIDTLNNKLYGPYSGSWGAGVSLIGPQGPQGVKGDTGATGSGAGLNVVDANGKVLGTYMGLGSTWVNILVLSNGDIYEINASSSSWAFPSSTLFFTAANCAGTAYSNSGSFRQRIFTNNYANSVGQPLYRSSNEAPFQINYSSLLNSSGCINGSGTMQVTTAQIIGTIPSQPVGPITIQ